MDLTIPWRYEIPVAELCHEHRQRWMCRLFRQHLDRMSLPKPKKVVVAVGDDAGLEAWRYFDEVDVVPKQGTMERWLVRHKSQDGLKSSLRGFKNKQDCEALVKIIWEAGVCMETTPDGELSQKARKLGQEVNRFFDGQIYNPDHPNGGDSVPAYFAGLYRDRTVWKVDLCGWEDAQADWPIARLARLLNRALERAANADQKLHILLDAKLLGMQQDEQGKLLTEERHPFLEQIFVWWAEHDIRIVPKNIFETVEAGQPYYGMAWWWHVIYKGYMVPGLDWSVIPKTPEYRNSKPVKPATAHVSWHIAQYHKEARQHAPGMTAAYSPEHGLTMPACTGTRVMVFVQGNYGDRRSGEFADEERSVCKGILRFRHRGNVLFGVLDTKQAGQMFRVISVLRQYFPSSRPGMGMLWGTCEMFAITFPGQDEPYLYEIARVRKAVDLLLRDGRGAVEVWGVDQEDEGFTGPGMSLLELRNPETGDSAVLMPWVDKETPTKGRICYELPLEREDRKPIKKPGFGLI